MDDMKSNKLSYLIGLGLSISSIVYGATTAPFQVGGYFENWAQYRGLQSNGSNRGIYPSCTPAGFSTVASNLTVFNYAFFLFNYDIASSSATNLWTVNASEWNDGTLLYEAADLKSINANLKIMLSVGGWNFCQPTGPYGSTTYTFFSQLLNNSSYQTAFINSLTNTTDGLVFQKSPNGNYVIDGVDIDYEYAGQVGTGANTDYEGFITFISALRTALKGVTGRPPCYLSVTLTPYLPGSGVLSGTWTGGSYPSGITGGDGSSSYSGGTIDPSDPSSYFAWMSIVANHCDWANLMTYDMYGSFNGQTGTQYQAPLYNTNARPYSATTIPDNSQNGAYSIDYAVWMWTQGAQPSNSGITGGGIPANKILLGLPSYGRSYGNASQFPTTNPVGPGVSWTVPGAAQYWSQQPGMAFYYELIQYLPASTALSKVANMAPNLTTQGKDSTKAQSYIVFNGSKMSPPNDLWVYDSINDFKTKTQYAINQGLGGVFLYALSMDYLTGGPTSYSFTKSLLTNGVLSVTQAPGSQTSTTNYSDRSPSQ